MDIKADLDELGSTEMNSCQGINKLDKNVVATETKDLVCRLPPSILVNGGASLIPITPDSKKENLDLMSTFKSPLTLVLSPQQSSDDTCMNEDGDDDGPSTPREGVFDPFAPGPDKLMMAPLHLKYHEESQTFVARRLNFNSLVPKDDFTDCDPVAETEDNDDILLETVYESLLDAIISKQAEDILGKFEAVDDVLKTPPSAPRLTGIADTCPGAPIKPVRKLRNIDLSLCRKLEF